MGYKGELITEKWTAFVIDICERIFMDGQQAYFILQYGFHQPIIDCLIDNRFIIKAGSLSQCCSRLGINDETRKANPVMERFNGQASVYQIIRPLAEFDWSLLTSQEQWIIFLNLNGDPVGPFSSLQKATQYLRKNGYIEWAAGCWQKEDIAARIQRLIRPN